MKPDTQPNYEQYYHNEVASVLTLVNTSSSGLTNIEARRLLEKFGQNVISIESPFAVWKLLLRQFQNLLTLILLGAAVISFFVSSPTDAAIILVIVLLNVLVGFFQEYKAETALRAIKKLVSPVAVVFREDKEQEIAVEEIVPGDILVLHAGARVAADARVISCANLSTDESMLTGESHVKYKTEQKIQRDALLTEMDNIVFMGTMVTSGHGKAVVVATGESTQLGTIGHLTAKQVKEASPLQRELDGVAKRISLVVFFIAVMIFITGLLSHGSLYMMLMYSLSVAVACVPEGLPATVTIALAIGVQRLVKRKALVKQLSSVETLGSTNVICADKTGTLTQNQMTVKEISFDNLILEVSGEGYESKGEIKGDISSPALQLLVKSGALCNDAIQDAEGEFIGDPTEIALCVLAQKTHMSISSLRRENTRILEKPFDSERKMMSVVCRTDKGIVSFTKGSPSNIIEGCLSINRSGRPEPLTSEMKNNLLETNRMMADRALRVLAFAVKETGLQESAVTVDAMETDMTFIGFVGMMDPPRQRVMETIDECRSAGIQVTMITGDQSPTALATARNIGLIGVKDDRKTLLTGRELDTMPDQTLTSSLDKVRIFAQVTPYQKNTIVSLFQKTAQVIAMTGDGVNDVPALKKANIGVAMGSGSDIAKEAADMILLDDSFTTIVEAVRFGRGIYENIKKFILYVFAGITSELLIVLASVFSPLPLTITAIQILWIDLGMEVLPALALSVEDIEDSVMLRLPRSKKEHLLNKSLLGRVGYIALWQSLLLLFLFIWALKTGTLQRAQTLVFTTLIMFQMFNVFNCRSFEKSVFSRAQRHNKYLYGAVCVSVLLHLCILYLAPANKAFGTVPLTLYEWGIVIIISLSVIPYMETIKFLKRKRLYSNMRSSSEK